MKTILIFVDWFRPGYKAGGPIQSVANLIDHLEGQYRFLVITRDTDYCDNLPYPNVESDSWNTLREDLKVFYISRSGLTRKNLIKLVLSLEFDAAYINGMYSWYFSILPLMILRNHPARKIVAPRGMLSDQAFTSSNLKKRLFLSMAKILKLYKNAAFQSTNERETQDISRVIGRRTVIVEAPNLPKKANGTIRKLSAKRAGELKLVSVARISPEKNNHYAIQSLLRVNGADISFDLIGPVYNGPYGDKCRELARKTPENVRINFLGPQDPEEVEGKLPSYHFTLFPSTGENFGHAIYESLSMGVPVIISDQTPWRNLAAQSAGWDLPLNDPDKWIHILEKCAAMEQEEYENLCRGAKELARKYVAESNFVEQYKTLFG